MYARVADAAVMATLPPWNQAVLDHHELVPAIVAHELVHYQQRGGGGGTLLAQALREGTADFAGELISGRRINTAAYEYGAAHERTLWQEFAGRMGGSTMDGFLYNGGQSSDRPADLGYVVGYRIARACHARAADTREALRVLLTHRDAERILRESGYAERFGP